MIIIKGRMTRQHMESEGLWAYYPLPRLYAAKHPIYVFKVFGLLSIINILLGKETIWTVNNDS